MSWASASKLQPKVLTNPVNPVSVEESGNKEKGLGTPLLSFALEPPLEPKVNGTKLPVFLSSSVDISVQVPPQSFEQLHVL